MQPTIRTLPVQISEPEVGRVTPCAPPAGILVGPVPSPGAPSAIANQKSKIENSDATLDFVASDATLDRYSESIDPSGWKLENYQRNPVFQNSHQYGDILFTLGRALIPVRHFAICNLH